VFSVLSQVAGPAEQLQILRPIAAAELEWHDVVYVKPVFAGLWKLHVAGSAPTVLGYVHLLNVFCRVSAFGSTVACSSVCVIDALLFRILEPRQPRNLAN
jgi:hypothetical protein